MRCPKCQYISFDSGDRCRNCGYEFSLAPEDPRPVDVTIARDEPSSGRPGDGAFGAFNTPLSIDSPPELITDGVHGKAVTPYLLGRIVELSHGRSLEVNLDLVRSNIRVAAAIATAYAA